MAVWPVGRVGTATPQGVCGARHLTLTRRSGSPAGVPTHEQSCTRVSARGRWVYNQSLQTHRSPLALDPTSKVD
eukprot:4084063-Alexandrium_andersonii.AAC.1